MYHVRWKQGKIFKLNRYMLLRMANAIFKMIMRFDTVVKHDTISFLKVLFAVVLQPEGKQIPEIAQTHLSDSYPAFFLPIATTSNKKF